MQGLESLSQFKNFVSSLGGLGRYGDTYMIHAEEGETVVPMEVLDRNPVLKKRLFKSMKALGIDPGRYIVGNDLNSLNPVTGQPEFFLKWVGRRLRKAAADISGYAAPIVGAMYGPAAGAATGAMLGQYKRENPGDPSQWQQMAMRGGLSGLATNVASGQNPFFGTGGAGVYDTYDPAKMLFGEKGPGGGGFFNDPGKMWDPKYDFLKTGEIGKKETGLTALETEFTALRNNPAYAKVTDDVLFKKAAAAASTKTGIPMGKIIAWGLGLGALEKFTSEDQDVGDKYEYELTGDIYDPVLNPKLTYGAEGGIMDLQGGGESRGPGTGTSDSIPAMLSDGEFVMTADAVRGAGGGNRREGARKMYEAMDRLEARV